MSSGAEAMDLEKRTATISARIPDSLEGALQRLAEVKGGSLSDLIYQVLLEYVAEEQWRYQKLKTAFDNLPDLPRKSA